jgi:riboflavin kinase/FMN adenylyltransferase
LKSGQILGGAFGIYAGLFELPDGTVLPTAISLGHRPTFYERPADVPLLECHLIGFSGDIYGEAVQVRFVERLRGEVRFESADALVDQIRTDVAQTTKILAS